MLRTLFVYMALLSSGLALAGCGQKGPLYMPEEEPATVETPPPPASQTQADTD
jgi:predicted small lipoprotein YifL